MMEFVEAGLVGVRKLVMKASAESGGKEVGWLRMKLLSALALPNASKSGQIHTL